MTTATVTLPPKARRPLSPWEFWGRVLVVPYLLIFLIFVLYPVGYGLWLARHPASYVKLFEDPIFFAPSSTRWCSWSSASTSRW